MSTNQEYDHIVVHYAEIGLKGKNRSHFENLLTDNIRSKLKAIMANSKRESGQIVIILPKNADLDKARDALSKIPGIAYFSFAKKCNLDIEDMKKATHKLLEGKEFETFKVNTRRHDKKFALNSMEINQIIGQDVSEKYSKKANMKFPDLIIKIDVSHNCAYVSTEAIPSVGGMPTQKSKKVVALLSGGFDSPVAAYLMMKRGCEVILVHFHNKNQLSKSVKGKIEKLAKQLSKFQVRTKLYIIPFEDAQKEIIMKVQAEARMLVYRKFMLKIASKIAKIEKAKFLVVGDSLSQVASQTLDNLEATYDGSEKGILSPLIGLDKTEIMAISRTIGTHDISEMPYGDCCSFFLPKHPVLNARKSFLREQMANFDSEKLIDDGINNAEIKNY